MANWIPRIVYNAITLNFTSPPEGDPINERLRKNIKSSISLNGTEQVSWRYNEETITINFRFLTSTEYNSLKTFWDDWASKGKSFDYYTSNDESARGTYVDRTKSFSPSRVVSDGASDFFYDLSLTFRRVI